jgi:hypothetical protein
MKISVTNNYEDRKQPLHREAVGRALENYK